MQNSKTFLLFILFWGIKSMLSAQNKPDDIVGYYLVKDIFSPALSQIHIYNTGKGTYEAIVIWVSEKDQKQNEGLLFLWGMTFNAVENEWQNVSMLYPGKSWKFSAWMRFEKDGRLRVRGYWGVSLFGKTVYFTREEKSRNPKIQPILKN